MLCLQRLSLYVLFLLKTCYVVTGSEIQHILLKLQSEGDALTFYNVTSNITVENVKIGQIQGNGVTVIPKNTKSELLATNAQSTFLFCDAEVTLNILPREEYHFYGHRDGSGERNCKRLFVTSDDHVIHLEMKATYSAYTTIWAEFYDGPFVDDTRKIYTFKVDRQTVNVST